MEKRYAMMILIKRKVGVAILRIEKFSFRIRNIINNKSDHFILLKGCLFQETIAIPNIYAYDHQVSKCG